LSYTHPLLPEQIVNGTQSAFNQFGQQVFGTNPNTNPNINNRPLTPSEIFNSQGGTVVPPVQQPHQVNAFANPGNPNLNPSLQQQQQQFPYPNNPNYQVQNQGRLPDGTLVNLGTMHNVNQPPLSSVQFGNTPSGQPQWPSSGLGNVGWAQVQGRQLQQVSEGKSLQYTFSLFSHLSPAEIFWHNNNSNALLSSTATPTRIPIRIPTRTPNKTKAGLMLEDHNL
jgi:hypothetical protein